MNGSLIRNIMTVVIIIFLSQGFLPAEDNNDNPDKNPQDVKVQQNVKTNTNDLTTSRSASEGDNLFATVKQGGPMMIFIILLGLAGLTIIIERIIFYIKSGLWKKSEIEKYLSKITDESGSKFREQLDDELRDAFQIYINSAEKGMALLNGIGNIAPIFGFLGTVIGMIGAFAAIAAATTVNAKVVAVGIQVALVTTAGGLIVAAPLLLCFHYFNHIIQNIYKYADEIIFDKTGKLPSILEKKIKSGNAADDGLWQEPD